MPSPQVNQSLEQLTLECMRTFTKLPLHQPNTSLAPCRQPTPTTYTPIITAMHMPILPHQYPDLRCRVWFRMRAGMVPVLYRLLKHSQRILHCNDHSNRQHTQPTINIIPKRHQATQYLRHSQVGSLSGKPVFLLDHTRRSRCRQHSTSMASKSDRSWQARLHES